VAVVAVVTVGPFSAPAARHTGWAANFLYGPAADPGSGGTRPAWKVGLWLET